MPEPEIFSGASRRDTPVVLVAKTEQDARDLLLEMADDPRVVMAHVELGDGKYLIPERDRG